jgi:hypothetical protein
MTPACVSTAPVPLRPPPECHPATPPPPLPLVRQPLWVHIYSLFITAGAVVTWLGECRGCLVTFLSSTRFLLGLYKQGRLLPRSSSQLCRLLLAMLVCVGCSSVQVGALLHMIVCPSSSWARACVQPAAASGLQGRHTCCRVQWQCWAMLHKYTRDAGAGCVAQQAPQQFHRSSVSHATVVA